MLLVNGIERSNPSCAYLSKRFHKCSWRRRPELSTTKEETVIYSKRIILTGDAQAVGGSRLHQDPQGPGAEAPFGPSQRKRARISSQHRSHQSPRVGSRLQHQELGLLLAGAIVGAGRSEASGPHSDQANAGIELESP